MKYNQSKVHSTFTTEHVHNSLAELKRNAMMQVAKTLATAHTNPSKGTVASTCGLNVA